MTVFTRCFRPTVLALVLSAPALAWASAQDTLIAALDAYRANDVTRLAQLADSMPADPLRRYPAYWLTLKALDRDDDAQVTQFLAQGEPSLLNERVRREWLKKLAKRQNWGTFESEWSKLPAESRDEETQCYGDLLSLRQGRAPDNLDRLLEGRALPDGCNALINAAAARGIISRDWLWQRLRQLLAGNYTTQARQLAAANDLTFNPALLNSPARADLNTRQGQEAMLYAVEMKARSNLSQAAQTLQSVETTVGKSASGYGWGQLALLAARKQQMGDALQWFAKADRAQLNNDQWEWWTRAALRQEQWDTVQSVIQAMPAALAAKPAWQYWLARSLRAQNHVNEANLLLVKASLDRGYYGLLALDELGTTLTAMPDRVTPSDQDSATMKADPAVERALALHDIAQSARKPELRTDAQAEWRWAMRGRSDMQLLAASEIARQAGFYDMAIYSAERTKTQHDFSLRYLTPYREITQRYAKQIGIDDAWVYGLIRQESRFITVARSSAGASGLMQLMPNTARWVAKKMGLGNAPAVGDIDTNIQLGTWYMKYILTSLSGNPVLATAGYNAGPNRARAWQGSAPIEGTIYAETIPFGETRDYVQKVMTNATYYGTAMGNGHQSLKARMGTIPARGGQTTEMAP
ncbi:lytic transglycosylase domain-containing protein [Paludibacterium purpuratum]|uniref:Soluble lytic murein transglycosylase n=1 Tax=Paludibacterium purpuratum TaxID=1144873 RepID=A0A4R7B1X2_9NEIS|nr:lytic transglycosylase domain-containing protein [Paludibacterium purpuratum]TDR73823.1 soluble lytic murein transglycosylase [Paludibacterium purpuratum]